LAARLNDCVSFYRLQLVQQLECEQLAEVAEWQVDHLCGVWGGTSHGAPNLHSRVAYVAHVDLPLAVLIHGPCRASTIDRSLISHELLLVDTLAVTAAPTEEGWCDLIPLIAT